MAENKEDNKPTESPARPEDEELLVSYEEEQKEATSLQPEAKVEPEFIQNTVDEVKQSLSQLEDMKRNIENETKKKEEQQSDSDARSIFVKNVEYKTEPAQLKEHFSKCGEITRITIFRDPVTRHPLGYAYVEFDSPEAVESALKLTDSLLNNRKIIVERKRKNAPGMSRRRSYGYFGRFPSGGRARMFPFPRMGRYGYF